MTEYSREIIKEMFDGIYVSPVLPYDSLDADEAIAEEIAHGNGRISLSGVQPKFSMVVDNGIIRLARSGEQGTYILKPAPTALFILKREFCPHNEYLTMCLARNIYGIETAACALCYFKDGTVAYLTRRFDVNPQGGKYAQEDLASIAGLSRDNAGEDYKYSVLSYEDCADIIRQSVKAAPVEILKFFRLILFNYITLNDDAHLKNFSLIERRSDDYVLAPAYDLMNTSLHLRQPSIFALQKGLFREGMLIDDTHSVNRKSFVDFGKRIGLNDKILNKELDRFAAEYPTAEMMIRDCGLPDDLARNYLLSYKYRCYTLR